MNKYTEMNKRHQQEINALPLRFAFSDKQFNEAMNEWGLDPEKDMDKVCKIDFGGFCQKKDADLIHGTFKRHIDELEAAIAEDKTGDGFIYDMWLYELDNHEYGYTMEFDETIEAMGYTVDEIMKNPALKHGLEKAAAEIMERDE